MALFEEQLEAGRSRWCSVLLGNISFPRQLPSLSLEVPANIHSFVPSFVLSHFNKSSAVAEMGDRLTTIDMGQKWGGAAVGGWMWHLDPSNHLATIVGMSRSCA